MACVQVLGASDSVNGKTIQHRLEMRGSIPPWVLDRMIAVVKDAHPAKFQVHSEVWLWSWVSICC